MEVCSPVLQNLLLKHRTCFELSHLKQMKVERQSVLSAVKNALNIV